jgi:exonuclease SbcD
VTSIELKHGKKLLRKRSENIGEALEWLESNPDALVELTMVTRGFLTAEDRKKLMDAHSGIVSIIPELKDPDSLKAPDHRNIDLSQDLESLFKDYFRHEKGQLPGEGMINLFREVLSEEESV